LPVRRAAGRAGLGDGSPPALAAGQKLFGEGQTPVAGKRFKRVWDHARCWRRQPRAIV